MVQELKDKYPEYDDVEIEEIDEDNRPEEYAHFNHEFVPAYYVDGEHVFDGVPTLEIIEEILKKGIS
ncbi:MAG: thioredoxin family protein [Oscillospiraceae bacterium]|nr:thioredoxin family protein [Oscillospiraceae bacterium]